jgi:hypothetical protein
MNRAPLGYEPQHVMSVAIPIGEDAHTTMGRKLEDRFCLDSFRTKDREGKIQECVSHSLEL